MRCRPRFCACWRGSGRGKISFPFRTFLYRESHAFFALRTWWHRRGHAAPEVDERGFGSEGTYLDLVAIGPEGTDRGVRPQRMYGCRGRERRLDAPVVSARRPHRLRARRRNLGEKHERGSQPASAGSSDRRSPRPRLVEHSAARSTDSGSSLSRGTLLPPTGLTVQKPWLQLLVRQGRRGQTACREAGLRHDKGRFRVITKPRASRRWSVTINVAFPIAYFDGLGLPRPAAASTR